MREAPASAAEVERLIVAPLAEELAGLPGDGTGGGERTPSGALVERRRVGAAEVLTAVLGDGPGRAARTLDRLLTDLRPRRLLLIGVAGALDPGLDVGTRVRAARVLEARERSGTLGELANRRWTAPAGGDGLALSVPRVVSSAAAKRSLWEALGEPERAVVDLESAALARAADERGLDWAIVRCVLDRQEEDLPLDFGAASDAEGHVSRRRVILRALARPAALPGLVDLRRRLRQCAFELAAAALEWVDGKGGLV